MRVLVTNPPWPAPGHGARSDVRWPHRRSDKYREYPIYLPYVATVLEESVIDMEFIDRVAEDLSIERAQKEFRNGKYSVFRYVVS